MSEESSLGTARADIVVDTTKMEGSITRAKTLASSLGTEFEQTYVKMSSAQKRATDQTLKFADQIGKTREEIRLQSLEAKGAAPQALEAYRQALVRQTQELQKAGLSTRAYAAAMRGVPAQITDIVVSLQGGQRPLTVLMQQGGQLKDMFGGVVPAAKALGTSLLGLVNPYTVAAAGAATLAYVWYDATKASQGYVKALALTGNAIGATESKLAGFADALASSQKVGYGAAREAVTAVAQSGQIFGDNIAKVSAAAVAMEELTGQKVDQTVSEFAKLAKEPVEAVMKLNESQHFLTLEVYEQIRALEQQGKTQEAATLATEAAADATVAAMEKVRASQNWLERGWETVKRTASEAARDFEMIAGLGGKQEHLDALFAHDQIANDALDQLNKAHLGGLLGGDLQTMIQQDRAEIQKIRDNEAKEEAAARTKQLEQLNVNAQSKLDKVRDEGASKEEKKRQEIAKKLAGVDETIAKDRAAGEIKKAESLEREKAKAIAIINQKYQDKDNTAGSVRSAALQGYKDSLEKEKAGIAATSKVVEAQYHAREITAKEYYAKLQDLNQQEAKVEETAIRNQITYLQLQKVSGKDAIEIRKQIGTLEAEFAKKRMEHAAQAVSLQKQDAAYLKEQQRQIKDYSDRLKESTQTLREDMQATVDRISLGEREYELQKKLNDIHKERDKTLLRLKEQHDAKHIDDAVFEQNKAAVSQDAVTKEIVVREGFRQRDQAEQSGVNGLTSGWADYVTTAKNSAEQVRGALTNAFTSAEDAFVKFTETGKLSFKDLANSVVADLSRMAAKQLVMSGMNALSGGGLGGLLGLAGAASSAGAVAGGAASLAAANGAAAGNSALALLGHPLANANGGVYASPDLHAYANTVVSKPTIFPFAKGVGLMGEAGPEAIMPIGKNNLGQMGVLVANPDSRSTSRPPAVQSANQRPTTINNTVVVKERTDRQTLEQINRRQGQATLRALARTGR